MLVSDERIPKALLKSLLSNNYDSKSEISASSLGEPIKISILKMRHKPLEVPEEKVFLLLGTAVHEYIDKHNEGETFERMTLSLPSGISVSGKIDLYYQNSIYDFKETSVFTSRKEVKNQYVLQLNCYKYLMEKNGKQVDNLYICNIYRDFTITELIRKFESGKVIDYPLSPVEIREVNIMDKESFEDILLEKISNILKYKDTEDDLIPECPDEEKWINKNNLPLRCVAYCSVKNYCNYFRDEVYIKYADIIDFLNNRFFDIGEI